MAPSSRSESRSRLLSRLQALEDVAQDVERGGAALEGFAHSAGNLVRDFEDDGDDVRGDGQRRDVRGRSSSRGRSVARDEGTQTGDNNVDRSSRSTGKPKKSKSKKSVRPKPTQWLKTDDGYEALDTFRAGLADAQELVDESADLLDKIQSLRQRLTGAVYATTLTRSNSTASLSSRTSSRKAVSSTKLARKITTAHAQILLTHKTIIALKIQYPMFTDRSSSAPQLTKNDSLRLKKEVDTLVNTFADALNFVEDREKEEKADDDRCGADERMKTRIELREPGWMEDEVLRELKKVKKEVKKKSWDDLKEDVDTFAWWWALEHPFTQIAGALGVIDNLEQGAQAAIEDEDDAKLGFLGRTAAGFREVMNPAPRPRAWSGAQVRRNKRLARGYFEIGKSEKDAGGNDSDQDLLGADGQLPYHIPTDNPNEQVSTAEILFEARAKRRTEHFYFPLLVFMWICIGALYIYWGVSRALGNENPLGNVDLGSHFGDDAWNDTSSSNATLLSSGWNSFAPVSIRTATWNDGLDGPDDEDERGGITTSSSRSAVTTASSMKSATTSAVTSSSSSLASLNATEEAAMALVATKTMY